LDSVETEVVQNERLPNFYDKDNTPHDDAPAEDLVDYWERWANASSRGNHEPSSVVKERLLASCETEPDKLSRFLSIIPDTPEAAELGKKLYEGALGTATNEKVNMLAGARWVAPAVNRYVYPLLANCDV